MAQTIIRPRRSQPSLVDKNLIDAEKAAERVSHDHGIVFVVVPTDEHAGEVFILLEGSTPNATRIADRIASLAKTNCNYLTHQAYVALELYSGIYDDDDDNSTKPAGLSDIKEEGEWRYKSLYDVDYLKGASRLIFVPRGGCCYND